MRILQYTGLDTTRVAKAYAKVCQAIAAGDFHAAQVRKLTGAPQGKFYRARLDDANRLLFTLVRHGNETCALMLEVIAQHDYAGSRFLRGAAIDEAKMPEATATATDMQADAQPLRYLHPERATLHLLDKPLSFDDVQEAIYREPAPLVLIGSAGSGKTALTLEKLKHARGEVLYVTHSAYLAQSARSLYHGHGFEAPEQEPVFLSYREFVESIHVPPGREAQWRDFAAWFGRMRQGQAFKDIDAHQAFEEIRGVLAAGAQGVLAQADYLALGVRQSIFAAERRETVYALFQKYRAWLAEAGLYDLNLVAQDWLARAQPRYDFVVVDEVQDLTPVQLALVLRTLRQADQFLLCGDSNQIVHPNFFSWAQVRALFWSDPALAERQAPRVLAANFRNGQRATTAANTLLKIKHARFGSIDRESNYLVQAVGGDAGAVELVPDKDAALRQLDQQTRQSTRFAVLVLRDEDKPAARQRFGTPLLFSIHEAKGLEYENIVLYRFVSDQRAAFAEITDGVGQADLAGDELAYRRARDKGDKSLEVYKFFVNALYVALTRAIRNVYLVESDTAHPLFALMDLATGTGPQQQAQASSLEDWQREARKLELQGKQEQAEAIRRGILKEVPVPWPVFDQPRTAELLAKVFRDQVPGGKLRQQLYDIATCHDEPVLAAMLQLEARFEPARHFREQRAALGRKSYAPYAAHNFKEILRQCERHGLEHRLPMAITPLMAAAASGNVPLVEALLERGADREAVDHYGCNPLHWALREAFRDPKYAQGPFARLYDLLAPDAIDLNHGERLVRVDRQLSEYLLFQTMWTLFKSRFGYRQRRPLAAFETQSLMEVWEHFPAAVLRPERNKRTHLSSVLSRNEVARDYAYNRGLFLRVHQGFYQFNPQLAVRRKLQGGERWVPVFEALNLPWVGEFALDFVWPRVEHYLQLAGMPPFSTPVMAERAVQQHAQAEAERARQLQAERERIAALELQTQRLREEIARRQAEARLEKSKPPPWGSPAAKRLEIERVRREIEARNKARGS